MPASNASVKVSGNTKFRELIIYLSLLSEGDESFGSVKLNKLLFYIDFAAYQRWGWSVTGKEYQKLEQGPAPRPLVPVLRELRDEGAMAMRPRKYYGREQKRPVAIREPDLSVFTAEEVDLIRAVVDRFWDLDGAAISRESHRFCGWQAAALRETIPHEVALIGDRAPNEREVEIARSLDPLATDCLRTDA